MARRGRQRNQGVNLGQVVNSAIQEGVDAIIDKHPRFADQEELLVSHLDKNKLNKYLSDYIEDSNGVINLQKLTEKFTGYVASGELFNKQGKELVLRESWGKEARKWWGGSAREILKGEQYLDQTMASFRDLYKLFKTGDYAERMPKLAQAVSTVYDMGFADAAVNVLYENGVMNKTNYKIFKKAITERAKEGVEYTKQSLAEYLVPEKVAAVVLGILGIGVLLSSNGFTGAVVGVGNTSISAFVFGGVALIAGIFLWFRRRP